MASSNPINASTTEERRRFLKTGIVATSAIVTIRPALARTMASVATCQITLPDGAHPGSYIAADGSVVPPGTAGAFAGPGRPLAAEDIKAALHGRSFPGADPSASQAWTNYIRRLQHGQSGFTCFASLQMPGR